ncbi:MAG: TauD/TfdA family dioxygenase [Alphaproteobacteria bacterium]|nr:TauD/TfdA family dioxygenase [Alphaproteobacteria bacterium]
MAKSTDWAYSLTNAEQDEFLDATRAARRAQGDIGDITQDDFPLPTFASKLAEIRREVVHGRGFVLLRNLPVEGLAFADSAAMYWGLGAYLGSARSQNNRGHLLGHVVDLGDAFDNKSQRGYLTNRHLKYHSDSVDIVSLMCLRKAKSGGLSSIVSSYTIHNEMWRRRPDLAKVLYGPVGRDRRDEIPDGKGAWYELPVFNYLEGRLSINYLRQHIETASRHADAPPMSDALDEALTMLLDLANDPELYLQMSFEPGDVQIIHNHQILHNRTAYEDWDDPDKRRYLLRLWLSPPDGITLPDAFAERYGSVTPGNRGGVVVSGTQPHVPLEAM